MPPSALIHRLAAHGEKLYVIALTPDDVSAFARDNWRHFEPWALVQLAKINNPEREHSLALVIREFTSLTDPATGLPIKRVGGCFIDQAGVHALTQREMRDAHQTDATTGLRLPPEPALTFVDFDQLLSRL
jgi:hypothetical protein